MRIERIESDVWMFVGDVYESVSTAFVRDSDVLLIDSLASRAEAEWMYRSLVEERGLDVSVIVATHYMNDHMAGMSLYPRAQTVAHRYFNYTFQTQRDRSADDYQAYVLPTLTFDDSLSLQWGRHNLQLFHNPGKTLDSINIDAPTCDLVFASDNIVGNIVYLSRSSPDLIDQAIARLQRLQRGRVIGGHMGMFDGEILRRARHYLRRLREVSVEIYRAHANSIGAMAVRSITIESCLAPGVIPTAFERHWHGRNLDVIIEQEIFKLDAIRGIPESVS